MTNYFVTATGTGIGKTFVTAALAYEHGLAAYKPISCGDTKDAETLMQATGQGLETTSPWRYAAPLTPSMAAAKEGKSINLAGLIAWSKSRHGLIEGVGGVMAPLTDKETILDWMKGVNWPVILVTGSYLGSLSHTLTALEVLKTARLRTQAIIISESLENSIGLRETRDALASFTKHVPHLITLPRAASWKQAEMDTEWME